MEVEKSSNRRIVEWSNQMRWRMEVEVEKSKNSLFRGSVIMEYLIVQVLVACALALFMHDQFFQVEYGRFVGVGGKIQQHYERIFGGLSLPVP